MELIVNGESKQFAAPLSVEQLLHSLELKGDRIAVELNRQIVRRDRWSATQLQENDHLEIVHFVGGG